jgi:hypothetical protein
MAGKNSPNDPQDVRVTTQNDSAEAGSAEAQTILRQTTSMNERMTDSALAAADFSMAASADAGESDITDELERGGPAFGSFVKSVGLAVAEAQKELDKTLVATAKELSETKIDVIAIFEQVINDEDGTMADGNVIMQKLPLINYLMPTAYQWSRVYLEADMSVSEFNSANGFNIQQTKFSTSMNANANFGLSGFGVGASSQTNFGFSNTNVSTAAEVDKAAGSLHMEATLEPRADIELPRPFVLQKGPKLNLSIKSSADLTQPDPNDSTKTIAIGRKVTIEATLTKTDGAVHSGRTLQVSVDRNDLTFVAATLVTDANGKLTIDIERRAGAAWDPATPRTPAVVRVSFGLVTETLGLSI